MINSISSSVQAQAVTQTTTARQPSLKPETASAPAAVALPTDTVKISSTAAALLKELTETSAQTAKEASAGDMQAQRLLAKEAAARK
jgi:hypothetical protein